MIELLVSVCLIEEPARCKDVSLTFAAEGMSQMQCVMGAPPEIAKWIDSHPKWALKRWTCQQAGQFAKI
jgi:hypothetical protein